MFEPPSTFIPDDLARLPEIVAADLDHTATSTVYAATTRDGAAAIEHALLWRYELGSEKAELLADADGSQNAPTFSPDGARIAFLQKVGDVAQLAVLTIEDRSVQVLTDFARGVGGVRPQWSPDGSLIAFAANDAPPRDPNQPYRVTRPVWRRDGMGLVDDVEADVWVIEAVGGSPRRLTHHHGVVTSLEWSPTGDRLLYSAFGEPGSASFAIRTVALSDSRVHDVMTGEYLVYSPAATWLGDGTIVRTTAWEVYLPLDLVVHDPEQGTDRTLGLTFKGQVFGQLQGGMNGALLEPLLVADPDGRHIYLHVQEGGQIDIHRVDVASGTSELLRAEDFSRVPLRVRGRHMLAARTSFTTPIELSVVDLDTSECVAGAPLDRTWLPDEPFAVHHLSITGQDGTPVEGWYLEPRSGSAPYPTVVNIHGGPFAGYGQIFSIDNHVLTSAGYGVLLVNFRGSSGYGADFASGLIGDWAHHDVSDIHSGIDHAVGAGLADPTRLGSFGLSGGGYMTSWLLTHSDRFAAGVAECPVTDWNGMVGSDIPQVISKWMGSEPGHGLEGVAKYARVAPITFAADCTTPMLIIEHEGDLRCPSGQGDVMFNALMMAGCPTEMLRLPGMFHADVYTIERQPARIERLAAIVEWFDRHIDRP